MCFKRNQYNLTKTSQRKIKVNKHALIIFNLFKELFKENSYFYNIKNVYIPTWIEIQTS